ncbi:hypothetical protein TIFTF001_023890 [Ficus carica]|uniref:Uncharacterized protein n=1 Tax=Ficus carica TaxID=3494 RepID=A0AA88B0C2_FICCA|nr:hypothetical protein TIFTF001_023890 [Ficus carica]
MARVLIEANTWQEDVHCEKEQGMNEIIGEVVYPHLVYPLSALVVYPSDLSLDGVLVPLELFLCGVSGGSCTTES